MPMLFLMLVPWSLEIFLSTLSRYLVLNERYVLQSCNELNERVLHEQPLELCSQEAKEHQKFCLPFKTVQWLCRKVLRQLTKINWADDVFCSATLGVCCDNEVNQVKNRGDLCKYSWGLLKLKHFFWYACKRMAAQQTRALPSCEILGNLKQWLNGGVLTKVDGSQTQVDLISSVFRWCNREDYTCSLKLRSVARPVPCMSRCFIR